MTSQDKAELRAWLQRMGRESLYDNFIAAGHTSLRDVSALSEAQVAGLASKKGERKTINAGIAQLRAQQQVRPPPVTPTRPSGSGYSSSSSSAPAAMGSRLGGRRMIRTRQTTDEGIEIVVYEDGGKFQTNPDGTTIEVQPNKTKITTFVDGTTVTRNPKDGSTLQRSPDGSTIEQRPDGTRIDVLANGTEVIVSSDGRRVQVNPDGSRHETAPDGTKVMTTASGNVVHETVSGRNVLVKRAARAAAGVYDMGMAEAVRLAVDGDADVVRSWLIKHKRSDLCPSFIQAGYDTLESVAHMTWERDLESLPLMKQKPGYRAPLEAAIKELANVVAKAHSGAGYHVMEAYKADLVREVEGMMLERMRAMGGGGGGGGGAVGGGADAADSNSQRMIAFAEAQAAELASNYIGEYSFVPDEENAELGSGAFGSTYKMKHELEGRVAAVKLIKLSRAEVMFEVTQGTKLDQAAVMEKMMAEVKTMSLLRHANIVDYYGSFEHFRGSERLLCIAMEFAAGGTLGEVIESGALGDCQSCEWDEDRIRDLFGQLCGALAYLHNLKPKGAMHRDIKSDNIFLSEDKSTVKLGDLGLATFIAPVGKGGGYVQRTGRQGQGAQAYRSPEECRGRAYDYKADVWSAGLVLLEMMGGYFINEYYDCFALEDDDERADMYEGVEGCTTLRPVMLECLRLEPAKRASAAGALQLLAKYSKPTAMPQARRAQPAAPALAGGGGTGSGGGGGGGSGGGKTRTNTSAATATKSSSSSSAANRSSLAGGGKGSVGSKGAAGKQPRNQQPQQQSASSSSSSSSAAAAAAAAAAASAAAASAATGGGKRRESISYQYNREKERAVVLTLNDGADAGAVTSLCSWGREGLAPRLATGLVGKYVNLKTFTLSRDRAEARDNVHLSHDNTVTAVVVWSIAGQDYLVTGSQDNTIKVWSQKGTVIRNGTIKSHNTKVTAMAVWGAAAGGGGDGGAGGDGGGEGGGTSSSSSSSSSSRSSHLEAGSSCSSSHYLVSGDWNGVIRLWEPRGDARNFKIRKVQDLKRSVRGKPVDALVCGARYIAASEGRAVRVWVKEGRAGITPRFKEGGRVLDCSGMVTCLATWDGALCAGTRCGAVHLWTVRTGGQTGGATGGATTTFQERGVLDHVPPAEDAADAAVRALCTWGGFLCSGGDNGIVRVWPAGAGGSSSSSSSKSSTSKTAPADEVDVEEEVVTMTSWDGRLAVAGKDNMIRVWE
eukprot:g3955.t1